MFVHPFSVEVSQMPITNVVLKVGASPTAVTAWLMLTRSTSRYVICPCLENILDRPTQGAPFVDIFCV
jgi:hypothetical protein